MARVRYPAALVRDAETGEPLLSFRGLSGMVVAEGTTTPLTLTDESGMPILQPLTVTSAGFFPTFWVEEGLTRASFVSGSLSPVPMVSPQGLEEAAALSSVAAAESAQAAAVSALAAQTSAARPDAAAQQAAADAASAAASASGSATAAQISAATAAESAGATDLGVAALLEDSASASRAAAAALVEALSRFIFVKIATYGNIALTGLYSLESQMLQEGDRVLAGKQTAWADSGIYVATAGAWSRASDATSASALVGKLVYATDRWALNGGRLWINQIRSSHTVGVNNPWWSPITTQLGVDESILQTRGVVDRAASAALLPSSSGAQPGVLSPRAAKAGAVNPATGSSSASIQWGNGNIALGAQGIPVVATEVSTVTKIFTRPATGSRIDLVYAHIRDNVLPVGGQSEFRVLEGIPSGSPVAPSLDSLELAPYWTVPIATVLVPSNTASAITVTDARVFTAAAGGIIHVPDEAARLRTAVTSGTSVYVHQMDTEQLWLRTSAGAWVLRSA